MSTGTVGHVLRALLCLSSVCMEVLKECALLTNSSRMLIQGGERLCRETSGSVLILLCFCIIKLMSFSQSSQDTYLILMCPYMGTALPWSVLLHLCPLLSYSSWKSTVTPRNR